MKTFADKLNELFETRRKLDGTPYTQEEVLQGTQGVISRVYLWKLRAGRTKNPGFTTMKVLADFFGVDLNYFVDDEIDPAQRDDLAEFLAEVGRRTKQFNPEDRQMVLLMIDSISRVHYNNGQGNGA